MILVGTMSFLWSRSALILHILHVQFLLLILLARGSQWGKGMGWGFVSAPVLPHQLLHAVCGHGAVNP